MPYQPQPGAESESGFTLVELMVVLLIIAVLLAIAIPTWIRASDTANARSTQENLRNALSAELINFSSTQAFAGNLAGDEPSLTWQSGTLPAAAKGGRVVSVVLYDENPSGGLLHATTPPTSTDPEGVMLVGFGRDDNCYAVYQSSDPTAQFTAYAQYPADASNGCAAPAAPTSTPASGHAVDNPTTQSSTAWYQSF